MQTPLELTFKNFTDHGGQITAVIDEKMAKLESVCDQIISCTVLIERLHNPKHHGHSFHVRIAVRIPPQHEIVVVRQPAKGEIQQEPLATVVRDAFIATRRQVQEIMDKKHHHVKSHTKVAPEFNDTEELTNADDTE